VARGARLVARAVAAETRHTLTALALAWVMALQGIRVDGVVANRLAPDPNSTRGTAATWLRTRREQDTVLIERRQPTELTDMGEVRGTWACGTRPMVCVGTRQLAAVPRLPVPGGQRSVPRGRAIPGGMRSAADAGLPVPGGLRPVLNNSRQAPDCSRPDRPLARFR